jgi:hypothetical protein
MKIQALRTITSVCFLLLLTAASAYAQADRIKAVTIPFPFVVEEKTLPAGTYRVARIREASELVWVIQRQGGRGTAAFITNPVRQTGPQDETRLVFNRYGGEYFLAQIWLRGDQGGRELKPTRRERELVQNGARQMREVVAVKKE